MIAFDNTYTSLPEKFYVRVQPEQVPRPQLFAFNDELARQLGLDLSSQTEDQRAALFTGQSLPEGASSLSLAYAGHQFGQFNPQLGDGRALLLGEVLAVDGERYDIQLKGSGATPWSRGGDGKSWVGPVIREYIISEAMHHLGVPTTRALAAATTGERVFRESPLPGGIFTRVASSHIRIGTFEFFAARRDTESLKILADYSIDRHYPQCKEAENPYLAFLEEVGRNQAALVAKWMSLGFIHGVMNTDNMAISGETIDYGPCAFMDSFSNDRVFSSIDRGGRYAYGNQIRVAQWNLVQLANCLVPLVDSDSNKAVEKLQQRLGPLWAIYDEEWLKAMTAKFGIFEPRPEDAEMVRAFLSYLEEQQLDFTIEFRRLAECTAPTCSEDSPEENEDTAWQDFRAV
ncbi:MAG: YdiU family protein, partial [Leptospiraceae bacterium]|nr:YdiU family protein [Leptospiraceae bacterium]